MADKIATRHAYGEALADYGNNPKIVVFDADVSTCTMSCIFGAKYPERFHNVGIAEANMIGIAAGMATAGYIPFIHSFSMFTAGRGYDQIRNSLAYPRLNVKIVGTHAGLTVGEDGATHQCLEDIGIMRVIPNMVVICPADGHETRAAVKAIIEYDGPVFLRLGRLSVDTVTDVSGFDFKIGKSVELREGKDVTIIAVGMLVQEALKAADVLRAEGIHARVLDMHTIKPLDKEAVLRAAHDTGLIVTAEEHNVLCGLGSAVSEYLSETHPTHVIKIGVQDIFGHSGDAVELMKEYGLTADAIVAQVKKIWH
jgi:transketolase